MSGQALKHFVYDVSDPYENVPSDKDKAWWIESIEHKITPEIRHQFETYCNIPTDQVPSHIEKIREKAWALRPYPCTGLGNFFTPSISTHPAYPSILQSLASSDRKLIDIGCYVGTDVRKLAFDGAKQKNLYAADILDHWGIGFDLYNDREKCAIRFVQGDLLNVDGDDGLGSLKGGVDYIYVNHVLHQWDWDTQVRACHSLNKLLSSAPGSIIFGYQVGTVDLEERKRVNATQGKLGWTMHDASTWKKMWEQVQEETKTKWNVEAELCEWETLGYRRSEVSYLGNDAALIRFTVTRL